MNETEELMALVPEGMFANASELQSFIDQQGMRGVYDLIPSGMFADVTELEEAFGSKKKEPSPSEVMPSLSPEEVAAGVQEAVGAVPFGAEPNPFAPDDPYGYTQDAPIQTRVEAVREVDTDFKPIADTESTRVDIKGPGEKIEEPEPEQDQFFEMSMAAVTPDLIDAPDDRDTAKELNYQFGRYGFEFTTTPLDFHDQVTVKAANGNEITVNLDPVLDIGKEEETEKLRDFLRKNKMQSEALTRAEEGYKEARMQFGTREQIDQEVTRINTAENDFRNLVNSYAARKDAIEQKHAGLLKYTQEYLDANPNEFEAYKAAFKMYQDDMATLEEDRIKLMGMGDDLEYQVEELNRAAGEFVKLKAEQSTVLGFSREALSRGTAGMFGEPVSQLIDIVSQVMPLGSGRGYEQKFIDIAQGMGLEDIPEALTTEAPEGSRPGDEAYTQWLRTYRKTYDDWYDSLPKQRIDEVRDEMRDQMAKGLKYNPEMGGMVDAAYEGVYRTLGDRKFNEEAYAKAQESFLGRTALSLLESVPAFIGRPGGSAAVKAASRFARMENQVAGQVDREFRADPELAKVSEEEKLVLKKGIGIVVGALEQFGFRNALGRSGVVNSILMRAINKAPVGVKGKAFRDLVQQEIKSAAARGLIATGTAALGEAETEFVQTYAEVGAKDIYNAMKGKEMFKEADTFSKETFFQAMEAAASGAIGGAVLGVPGSIAAASTTYDFTKLDDATMATFEFLANPGNRGASKQMFVTDLKNKVNRGELTGQQAKEAEANYEKVVQAYDGMREVEGMTMEEKKQVLGLEVRRQELLRRKEATAAPFQGRIDREISDLNLKIQDALQEREAAPVDVGERARAGERVDEEVREEEAVVTPEAEEEVIPEAAAATNQDRRAYDGGTLEAPRLEQLLSGVADKLRAKGRMTAFQSRLLTENRERVDTLVELKDRAEAEALREEAALDETVETLAPNVESRRVTTVDLNPIQERVVSRAQAAAKAVSQVAPNVKFVLHETTAQYNRATGFTGGGVFTDGTVHINLERADNRTVAHETLHAIMLSADGMTLPVAQQVTKRMATSLSKSLDKGTELKKRLDKFIARYDENVRDEEKVAELFGYMADGYANLEAPQKSLIRRYVERIAETFGVKLPSGWGQQDQDVIDFLNTVSRKVAAGEVITEEEVAVTRATREEQRAKTDENLRAAEQRVADFSDEQLQAMADEGVIFHFGPVDITRVIPEKLKRFGLGYGFYFTDYALEDSVFRSLGERVTMADSNELNLLDGDTAITEEQAKALRSAAKTELQEAEEYGDDLGFEESQVLMSIAETRAGEQWYAYFTSSLDDNRKVESELTDEQKATAARLVQEMLGFDGVTYGSDQRNTGVITSAWNFNKLNRAIIPPTRAAEQRVDIKTDGTSIDIEGNEPVKAGQISPTVRIDATEKRDASLEDDFRLDDIDGTITSRASAAVGTARRLASGKVVYTKDGVKYTIELPYENKRLLSLLNRRSNAVAAVKGSTDKAKAKRAKLLERVKETTNEILSDAVEVMTQNILAVYDTLTPEFVAASKEWYVGANRVANRMAEIYGVTVEEAAGVLAALSPQNDWFNNIAVAERTFEVLENHSDTPFSEEIFRKAYEANTQRGKPSKWALLLAETFEQYGGMTLNEMEAQGVPVTVQTNLLRAIDQAMYPGNVLMTTPDGDFIGFDSTPIRWSSPVEIAKAMDMYRNPSIENIREQLGGGNKVRNFYNNIVDPNSTSPYVTADTHAASVALGIPMSANDAGGFGVFKGGRGIEYALIKEAYINAAEIAGILPREMQSITWEAQRTGINNKNRTASEIKANVELLKRLLNDETLTPYERTRRIIAENPSENPGWATSRGIEAQLSDLLEGIEAQAESRGREVLSLRRGAGRDVGDAAARVGEPAAEEGAREQARARAAEQRVADVVERYKFRPDGSLIGDSRLAAELGRNLERYGFGVEQFGDRMNRFFIVDADGRRVDPKKLVAEDRADEREEMQMRAEERAAQEARELAEREQELFETEEAPFLETIFPESDLPAREQKDDLDKSGPTELDRLVAYAKERGYSNAAILLARPEAQDAIDAYEESEKRMLKELNGVIKMAQARTDFTPKRVLESALIYLQGSKFYADATDLGRELMVRGLREKLGVREKRAPSAKRIVSGPVERVTLTVREALNNQLKSEARGARAAAAASKAVLKQMAADITELQREGKITAKQAATVIRRFASVNVFNPVAVDNFLDYMAKVFADAEYANDMARLRKMRPTAKKNVKRKLGRQPELISDILTVLAIDPTRIPVDTLPQYRNLLDIMSKRRAVLELPDIQDLVSDVKSILDAVNEEQSLADELADIFEAFDAKVPTKAGGINFNETLKAMVAAEVITDADATLMRKYKSDIVDTSRAEKTEEQLEVEAEEMRSIIRGSELSINRLGTRLDRDAARKFEKLLKTEAVNELNNRQLENLLRVIDNINNGYLTHSAQLAIERMEAKNRARSLNEALKGAKLNTIREIGGALTNVKDARLGAIVRNPLELIDQVFGNFKTTPIYDATLRPIAEAAAAMMTEKGKIGERLTQAQIAVAKSHKRNPNAIVRSKYLMTTYLLQLEHESNPGNKQTPSAMAFLDATINAAEDGTTTKYNAADIGILKGIKDKYTKGKEIDAEAIYSDFNAAERNALKTVQEINLELTPKAEFASSVIRGAAIEPILNYLHHSVLPDESLRTQKTDALRLSEAYNQRMRPSTRAKTFVDRTAGAKPIEFDIMATVNRGANQTLTDFYLTEPIRTARKALNETETDNKEVLRSITNAVDGAVRNALERSVTTSNLAEKALDLVAKQGYRTMLASIPRFASELISNLSYVALADPAAFEQGIKYRDYFGVDGADIMTNVGSAQTKRVYPSERLSGRMVDTSIMSGHMGSAGSRAGRESLNSMGQMLNYAQEYPNAVALVADGLISTPDKLIMRPLWFGAFAKAFKAETGRDVDYDAIARNDEAYMTEFAEAIEAAKREADRVSAQAGATDNPFMGIQKGKSKGEMKPLMQTLRIANNFMSRFIIYEFTAARTGIQAAVGNGTITQEQGVRLFAAVVARMTMYSLLTPILSDMFVSLFTDVPEEDEEPDQLFTRALLSGLTTMAGGVMGQLGRIPVNYGIEAINERYLDFLRDGEYDPYDDYLQFNNVPDFKRGTDFADFMFPLMGAGAPMARTAELGLKTIGREGKKRATRERYAREQMQRLPLEVLGNLGLVPFYRDVRKVLITDMYGDMDKKKKKGGIMAN